MKLKLMPFLAILRHELRSLWSSWLVRLWVIAAALLTFLLVSGNWSQMQTAPLVAYLISPYLVFPWFIVVIVLGVTPVTGSRAEALADGVLSRPITRHEYLLASWSARVVTVLGAFLLVTLPAVMVAVLAKRPVAPDPVTWYGVIASLGLTSLVLTFLVSLGFLAGTLFRGAVAAMVVLLFIWFPITIVLNTLSLEEFSPISFNQAMPTLLRQPWTRSAQAEPPSISEEDVAAAINFLGVLSGTSAPAPKKKVEFYEHEEYEDFALWRVLLGYGLPTLFSVGLALVWFSSRDM